MGMKKKNKSKEQQKQQIEEKCDLSKCSHKKKDILVTHFLTSKKEISYFYIFFNNKKNSNEG
jgi:hypothetical protein